ncbi:MAG: hypothetical protein J5J06_17295 [Phycisphaerae bacterium]|nr:hypothetical protein [Phycisphaerae bacterium]
MASSHQQQFSDISRRLLYSLALIPIIPATSSLLTICLWEMRPPPAAWDELRCWHLLLATLTEAAVIIIWRRMVLWTLGKSLLTGMIGMIPFVQVAIAQGWWSFQSSGCFDFRPELLRTGQFHLGLGFWSWLLVWVWWGMEKTRMQSETTKTSESPITKSISPLGIRIILSMGYIPVVFGLFWIVSVAIDSLVISLNDPYDMGVSYLAGSIPAIVIWAVIWKRLLPAPKPMIARAVLCAVLLIDIPAALLMLVPNSATLLQQTLYVGPIIGWGVWMGLTPRLWFHGVGYAPGGGPDVDCPRCIECGYPLIGLTSTRCPECGAEPTLDELWQTCGGDLH